MRVSSLLMSVALLLPLSSHAGLLSLLSKAGKAGRVASTAGKLGRAAKLAKVAAGVSTVVVAERATASMARLGSEAAHAGYLARGAGGELVMATSHHAPVVVDDLGKAVAGLAEGGVAPKMVLDPSIAAAPEALAALPADVELAVVEGAQQFPVKRVKQSDGTTSFLVDHGGDLVDLGDYASQFAQGDEESGSEPVDVFAVLVGAAMLAGIVFVWKRAAKA
jgi:hypothetical protein